MPNTEIAVQQPTEFYGFYEDMPFEEYAAVDALNGSKIVQMRRSAKKYKHERDNPTPPTSAMEAGKMTHLMVLEPKMVGEIAVWGLLPNEKVRNGKVWEAFQEDNVGRTILTVAEYMATTGMATAALAHAPISHYANAIGPTEVSLFWIDPQTGRRFKARLDKVIPETHTIFDLKTTRDCHSYQFGAQSYKLGYHIKMALYWRGYKELTGVEPEIRIGAIDSKAPHESAVYRMTRDVVMQGLEELDALVRKIADCEKEERWPAEYEEETDLLLPSWATDNEYEGMT